METTDTPPVTDTATFLGFIDQVRANSDRMQAEQELRDLTRDDDDKRQELKAAFTAYLKVADVRAGDFIAVHRVLLEHVEMHDRMRELREVIERA